MNRAKLYYYLEHHKYRSFGGGYYDEDVSMSRTVDTTTDTSTMTFP